MALALCVVVGGRRVWPGILLGAFFTNAIVGQTFQSNWLSLAIGVESTLQAVIGAIAWRRADPEIRLDNGSAIRRIIGVTALVCLVGTSIGNASLYWWGILDLARVPGSLFTWWLGDMLGVLIFAPLVLAFAEPRLIWKKRRIQVGIPLLMALLLCGLIYRTAASEDQFLMRNQFNEQADALIQQIGKFDESNSKAVKVMATLTALDNVPTQTRFLNNAAGVRREYPSLQSLNWIPFVRKESLQNFEQKMSAQYGRKIVVTTVPGHTFSATGWIGPIEFIEPIQGNEAALGRDMLSEPIRQAAIQKARTSDELTASGKIQLVQDLEGPGGILIVAPVRSVDNMVVGVVTGVANLRDLLRPLQRENDIAWSLRDLEDGTVLSATLSAPPVFNASSYLDRRGLYVQRSLTLADRRLTIILQKPFSGVTRAPFASSSLVLLLGLLTCTGLVMFTLVTSASAERTEVLVMNRTLQLREEIQRRDKSETELLRSETKFRTLFDSTSDAVWLLDEHGFIDCNPAALTLFGCSSKQELAGKRPTDLSPALQSDGRDSKDSAADLIARTLQQGSMRFEWDHKRIDTGATFPAEVILTALDFEGKQILQAVVRDITDRKFAERAMRLQSEKDQALLRNASDGVHIVDSTGKLIECSDSFCTMLGYARNELLGMTVAQWDADLRDDRLATTMTRLLAGHERIQFETRHRRKDGSVFDAEVSVMPLDLDGQRVIFSSSRDITKRKEVELALKQSEEKFSLAFSAVPEAITIVSMDDGKYVDVNDVFLEITGFERAEIIGHTSTAVGVWVNSSDQARFSEAIATHRSLRDFQWQFRMKDGSIRDFSVSAESLELQSRPFTLNFIRDITESNRAEADLRVAATAFESQEGILITNADRVILRVNRAFCEITGYSAAEVIGQTPRLLKSGHQGTEFYEAMSVALRENGVWQGEILNHRKNGERYTEWLTITAVKDDFGTTINYVGTMTDITERKRIDELLLASEKKWHLLFENMPTGFALNEVICDANGNVVDYRYLEVNPAYEKLTGLKISDLVGKTILEVLPGTEAYWIEKFGHVALTGEPASYEYFSKELGKWYRVRIFCPESGQFAVMTSDITERKVAQENLIKVNAELEERVFSRTKELADINLSLQKTYDELKLTQNEVIQNEKMKALGVLIAGVSHEMNTPLGNSLTVCSSLQDEILNFETVFEDGKVTKSRLKDFNQFLHNGIDLLARNLNRAIEQLTHFKQVSVDQASEQHRNFELKSVIADNVSVLKPQFKHTAHQIVIDVSNGIQMNSYPGALGQVIANLVLNSLIHGFSFDMKGVVSIAANIENEQNLKLIIADNGKGIPEKNLDRIFDPFFTTRMGQGGSGLGLNIVFNIVKSTLGGNIHVDSEEGKSTVFTIIIPLTAPLEKSTV